MTEEEKAEWVASGILRESSREVMEAIAALAWSLEEAERIWEDPTPEEINSICATVSCEGLLWGLEDGASLCR